MRTLIAVVLAAGLMSANAFAASSTAPLSAGKPAGVKKAQAETSWALVLIGAGVAVGGIVLAAGSTGSGPAVSTTLGTP